MNISLIYLAFLLLSILPFRLNMVASDVQSVQVRNPYDLPEKDVIWMREATMQQLQGCRVKGADGTWLHTPDGVGNYKALWTRDFYYMVEYAGNLLNPQEIKASINYLLNGQREDGCIPDRVNPEGKPVYSPGPPNKPMADHALDNGPFMALLVCSYINQFHDKELFCQVEDKLRRGLDFIRRGETGLVFNDPQDPQCVYGFTDIVKKTGNLLFSSLLYFKACVELEQLCSKYGCGDPIIYRKRAEAIRQNISSLWDAQTGMFWAADKDCKQIDIWGSAYAVEVGITSEGQANRISDFLAAHYDEIAMKGQFRHLSGQDSGWNSLFISCKEGTYQNGAYWATPLAWIVPVIEKRNLELANEIVQTVVADFQENGINECINVDYIKIPNYVVSATNVYCLTRFR